MHPSAQVDTLVGLDLINQCYFVEGCRGTRLLVRTLVRTGS
jgi:hypothetical protein